MLFIIRMNWWPEHCNWRRHACQPLKLTVNVNAAERVWQGYYLIDDADHHHRLLGTKHQSRPLASMGLWEAINPHSMWHSGMAMPKAVQVIEAWQP